MTGGSEDKPPLPVIADHRVVSHTVAKPSGDIPLLTSSVSRCLGEESQHVFLDKILSVLGIFNGLSLAVLQLAFQGCKKIGGIKRESSKQNKKERQMKNTPKEKYHR